MPSSSSTTATHTQATGADHSTLCRYRSLGALLGSLLGACSGDHTSKPGSDGGLGTADAGNKIQSGGAAPDGAGGSTQTAGSGGRGGTVGSAAGAPQQDDGGSTSAEGGRGTEPDSGTGSNLPPFGSFTLHPDRLGFYMVPDIEDEYRTQWDAVRASLDKLHALMPDAWIRWDNETGHNTNDTAQVTKFVDLAQAAGVPLIIAASACPGYNNMWANRYATSDPNANANYGIVDIANGGFLDFTNGLMKSHSVVKLIETINEPDGPGWFVTDPDNSGDFDYYLSKLYPAMGITAGNKASAARLVGPAVAFAGTGNIWNDYLSRSEVSSVSYHYYGDPPRAGLREVPGKDVYVTEYGVNSSPMSPATLLEDLLYSEREGRLSGTVKKIFYNQIFQNGTNPAAFGKQFENGQAHFALRGWFRGLAAWVALGSISTSAAWDGTHSDHVATDDRRGNFAMLLWNRGGATESEQTRTIANTSTKANTALNVLAVKFDGNALTNTGVCQPLAGQSAVSVDRGTNTVSVTVHSLESEGAILVTTKSCADLAD